MATARACVRCSAQQPAPAVTRATPAAPGRLRAAPAQQQPAAARATAVSDRVRAAAVGAVAGVLLLLPAAHSGPARAVDLVFASPAAVEGLKRRDESMQFKCRGGMMDCDGDRREYAKKQTENFVKRVTAAAADGAPAEATCKVEEACTKDVLGAAFNGLGGLSSAEKLEKMGRDATSMVNSTAYEGEP